MRLSSRTIAATAEILKGDPPAGYDNRLSPYRTLWQLTEFFRDFGERDIHPNSGAPSRFSYVKEKLEKFNGGEKIGQIICAGLDFWGDREADPEQAAAFLNRYLRRDGYEITREDRYIRMNGDTPETDPYFAVRPLRSTVIETATIVKLSEESITEHLAKARRKIAGGDHPGAIASAYTLVEEFIKALLRRTNTPFNLNEGDIRALYKLVAPVLNLDPKGEALENYLKAILDGLQRQLGGLYEVANKASDRHARRYNPAKHHAKLAVNAAFTLCEFLLDSYEYQQEREKKGSGERSVTCAT